jgi:RNA polymerase sigma factor (sigma-70 family)
MADEGELLRRYAENDSEEAFTELVNRYVNLVYSTALRVTNDTHAADEITQTVFTAMARKASSLVHHPALSGWLHRSTRYAAINVHQQKRRRTQLELEAYAMTATHEPTPERQDAAEIAPAVDELLDQLNERERHALILRFFEECSFAEIGDRLRMKEDASRMCVARALDKLRTAFARRGISSTTAALTLFLTSRAATSAPAGLAAAASAAALNAPAVATATGASLLILMATKTNVALTALLIAGAGVVLYQEKTNRELRENIAATALENQARIAELQQRNEALAKLKSEPAPAQAAPAVSSPPPSPTVDPTLPTPQKSAVKAIGQWSNAGRATPAAAFETLLWAAREGRLAEATAGIQIIGDDATALKSIFDRLSPSARELFGTPESMFITVNLLAAAGDSMPSGCEIIGEVATGADDAIVRYRWADQSRVRELPLRRTESGWILLMSGGGLTERQEMWVPMVQSFADDREKRRNNGSTSNSNN